MEIALSIEKWEYVNTEAKRTIAGSYAMKAGLTIIANQAFNNDYSDSIKYVFSSDLMNRMEELTIDIQNEIEEKFLGKDKKDDK